MSTAFAGSCLACVNVVTNYEMLLEGLDDVVLAFFVVYAAIVAASVWTLIVAEPPTLHQDAVSEVEQVRRAIDRENCSQYGRMTPYNDDCPICLGTDTEAQVVSNCGHKMCGSCFVAMHTDRPGLKRCPVCRARVTLLLFDPQLFVATNSVVLKTLRTYNRHYSGVRRGYIEQLFDAPVILYETMRTGTIMARVVTLFQFRIILTSFSILLYILVPLDIIPEAVFGPLGLIDDLLALVGGFIIISNLLRQVRIVPE